MACLSSPAGILNIKSRLSYKKSRNDKCSCRVALLELHFPKSLNRNCKELFFDNEKHEKGLLQFTSFHTI